jgi:hypothetical protein
MKKAITVSALLGVAGLLVGWDLYVYFSDPNDTAMISRVILNFAGAHPVLPFLAGVLCGHLFWPQKAE